MDSEIGLHHHQWRNTEDAEKLLMTPLPRMKPVSA